MKKKTGLTILLLFPSLALASVVASHSDEYLQQLRDEHTEFMTPSLAHWPILFISFLAALYILRLVARSKGVRIASLTFWLPVGGFLVFILIFTGVRADFAEMIIELADWPGNFPNYAKPPYLLGSEWYAGIVLSFAWLITHPLIMLRTPSPTRGKIVLAISPAVLLYIITLVWLWAGPCIGLLWNL